MEKRFGALSSSTDPEKLGNTVKGVILAVSTIIIIVAGKLGIPLTQGEVALLATQFGGAVSTLWIAFGLLQKIVVTFADKRA